MHNLLRYGYGYIRKPYDTVCIRYGAHPYAEVGIEGGHFWINAQGRYPGKHSRKEGSREYEKGQADTDDAAQKTTVNIKRHGNASII